MAVATFFKDAAEFREWLAENHDKKTKLWVGYYKDDSENANATLTESVDEAICYGWIDSIQKSMDTERYAVRFTPRKEKSIWSLAHIKRVEELTAEGRMQKSGLAIYAKRTQKKSQLNAFEQGDLKFPAEFDKRLKANEKAWAYFEALPNSYKKASIWWVISRAREATKERRFGIFLQSCEDGLKIPHLRTK